VGDTHINSQIQQIKRARIRHVSLLVIRSSSLSAWVLPPRQPDPHPYAHP
jgi:hypothetical protein